MIEEKGSSHAMRLFFRSRVERPDAFQLSVVVPEFKGDFGVSDDFVAGDRVGFLEGPTKVFSLVRRLCSYYCAS